MKIQGQQNILLSMVVHVCQPKAQKADRRGSL